MEFDLKKMREEHDNTSMQEVFSLLTKIVQGHSAIIDSVKELRTDLQAPDIDIKNSSQNAYLVILSLAAKFKQCRDFNVYRFYQPYGKFSIGKCNY